MFFSYQMGTKNANYRLHLEPFQSPSPRHSQERKELVELKAAALKRPKEVAAVEKVAEVLRGEGDNMVSELSQ